MKKKDNGKEKFRKKIRKIQRKLKYDHLKDK